MTNANGYSRKSFSGRRVRGYRPNVPLYWFHPAIREGMFTWRDIPAMLRNPTVQIGLAVLKSPIASAQWEVKTKTPAVQKFVDETLHRFWANQLDSVLDRYFGWGTCCGESFYADDAGTYKWAHLEEFWFFDTTARHRGTNVTALKVHGAWLKSPKLFFLAHDPILGNPYGRSRLLGAWGSWMERDGAHGARDTRRLGFFKYAYRGGIIWYPPGGEYKDETTGQVKDNQDIAREMVEKASTGAVWAMPMEYDGNGNKLWEMQDAQMTLQGAAELREYPKDLEIEILKGMKVLPEVVEAAEVGGGWSGRSVPLLLQLSMADQDVRTILRAVNRCIVRPLVLQNFGGKARYEIEPVPFVPRGRAADPEQAGQKAFGGMQDGTGGNPQSIMGGGTPQDWQPVKMSQVPEVILPIPVQPTTFIPVRDKALTLLLEDDDAHGNF